MDAGDYPWTSSRLSTSSRRYQSRSEIYLGGDDVVEVEDDYKQEFMCPFCAEEFDMVGLCCHVDEEHPIELKHGVCPICAKRVEMDMVGHITMQHGNILKKYIQQRRRGHHRGGSNASVISMLRKELRDRNRRSLFNGHSNAFSSSNPDPEDPFLSSLVFSSPMGLETATSALSKIDNLCVDETITERVEQPQLSEKDQEEKARRCEFVKGILLSTIFD